MNCRRGLIESQHLVCKYSFSSPLFITHPCPQLCPVFPSPDALVPDASVPDASCVFSQGGGRALAYLCGGWVASNCCLNRLSTSLPVLSFASIFPSRVRLPFLIIVKCGISQVASLLFLLLPWVC